MNLNGTEWLVEKDWKNFEKNRKSFGTVFNILQKNTCERAFLETLDCNNFSKVSQHCKKVNFSRKILQTYSEICIFLWCNNLEAVSEKHSQNVGKISENCLGWSSCYSQSVLLLPTPGPTSKPFLPQSKSLAPFQAKQLPNIPLPLDTLTIFSSNLTHS